MLRLVTAETGRAPSGRKDSQLCDEEAGRVRPHGALRRQPRLLAASPCGIHARGSVCLGRPRRRSAQGRSRSAAPPSQGICENRRFSDLRKTPRALARRSLHVSTRCRIWRVELGVEEGGASARWQVIAHRRDMCGRLPAPHAPEGSSPARVLLSRANDVSHRHAIVDGCSQPPDRSRRPIGFSTSSRVGASDLRIVCRAGLYVSRILHCHGGGQCSGMRWSHRCQ